MRAVTTRHRMNGGVALSTYRTRSETQTEGIDRRTCNGMCRHMFKIRMVLVNCSGLRIIYCLQCSEPEPSIHSIPLHADVCIYVCMYGYTTIIECCIRAEILLPYFCHFLQKKTNLITKYFGVCVSPSAM